MTPCVGASDVGGVGAVAFDQFAVPLFGPAARTGQAVLRRRQGRPARAPLAARRDLLGGHDLQRPPCAAAHPARVRRGMPAAIIVYFHGNIATLRRDVVLGAAGAAAGGGARLNAVLVAPQIAVNAATRAPALLARGGFAASSGGRGPRSRRRCNQRHPRRSHACR